MPRGGGGPNNIVVNHHICGGGFFGQGGLGDACDKKNGGFSMLENFSEFCCKNHKT